MPGVSSTDAEIPSPALIEPSLGLKCAMKLGCLRARRGLDVLTANILKVNTKYVFSAESQNSPPSWKETITEMDWSVICLNSANLVSTAQWVMTRLRAGWFSDGRRPWGIQFICPGGHCSAASLSTALRRHMKDMNYGDVHCNSSPHLLSPSPPFSWPIVEIW